MFGNLGLGELLITIFVIVPLYCLPIVLLVWLWRRAMRHRREMDDLRKRVAALEGPREQSK